MCYNKQKGGIMLKEKITTNVYLASNLKKEAKEIFAIYSMSLSQAIDIFLTQTALMGSFPFEHGYQLFKNSVRTNISVNQTFHNKSKSIFNAHGLNFSQAINIFLDISVKSRGLPFEVKIPS